MACKELDQISVQKKKELDQIPFHYVGRGIIVFSNEHDTSLTAN